MTAAHTFKDTRRSFRREMSGERLFVQLLPKHRPLDVATAVQDADDFDAGRHRPIVDDVLSRWKAAQAD